MAKLHFTHGPMGSQKSTALLGAAYNFEEQGGNVLTSKPESDTKGDLTIVSRIGISRDIDFLATKNMDLQAEVIRRQEQIGEINAFLVDEAQLLALAVVNAIPVMAYGLRTDFRTHAFPGSARLLEVAQDIRELVTMCAHGDGCKHKAQFNARMFDGVFVSEGEQLAIDGAGEVTYASLCPTHYLQDVGPIQAAESSECLPSKT